MSSAAESRAQPAERMDADSAAWIAGLCATGAERDETLHRLHGLLVRIASGEARRRVGLNGIVGIELDDLAHQAAADALVSILRRVDEFRGESRFTTWVYKFVVFEVANKFGRHAWRRAGVALDQELWEQLPATLGSAPDEVVASRELVEATRRAVDEVLTVRQRRVFVAIVVNAVPLDALVVELDSNRNAIYNTLFDARRKLYRHLAAEGHIVDAEVRKR